MEAFCLKRIASSEAVYVCLLVEDDPYEMESGIQSVGQSEKQISIRLSVVCSFAHTFSQSVRRSVSQTVSQSFWKLVI